MLTSAAQAKARDNWKAAYQRKPWAKRGAENPRWNGGPDATRKRNRERVSAYKKVNADKVRLWAATRRAKVGGKAPVGAIRFLRQAQRGKCAICACRLLSSFHLDHIYPVARGGTNAIWNLQLLCRDCNTRKAAKDPIQYMQSLGRLL
jgi:5-methylcytosine-specific restriction endonuclease McrA